MASFDIKSLFTNIPLNEIINIILDLLFCNQNWFQGFSRNEFKKLLEFSVKDNHFLFNNQLYEQVGVAMGSPVGPLFTNIFLSFYETSWLNNCPSQFKPIFYWRYVDDCFLLFRSSAHILAFVNYLNSQHANMKFSHETENNNTLPFLDIKINRSETNFTNSINRKSSYNGLLTNFKKKFCSGPV